MSTATAAPETAIESPLSRLSAEQIEELADEFDGGACLLPVQMD